MNIILRRTLSVTPLRNFYLSIKDLENWAEFNLLQNLHLCTQQSVCARNFGPLGEIGANFSLQLSSRTQLAKINNKKVIAENQCEKHKKSSLEALINRIYLMNGSTTPAYWTNIEYSYIFIYISMTSAIVIINQQQRCVFATVWAYLFFIII